MIVGPASTLKPLLSVAVPPSGLVTVTLRAPVAALAATDTVTVSCVPLLKVVGPVTPVPENDTVAPFTNPVPVIVIA